MGRLDRPPTRSSSLTDSRSADVEGPYRSRLARRWDVGDPLVWVLVNPSRADGLRDDPTLRRVVRFTRDAGFGACEVVNLYALRAARPDALRRHPDPTGPRNPDVLSGIAGGATVVVAWGAHPMVARSPLRSLVEARDGLHCLGTTRSGAPRHPLYVPASACLTPWTPPVPGRAFGA